MVDPHEASILTKWLLDDAKHRSDRVSRRAGGRVVLGAVIVALVVAGVAVRMATLSGDDQPSDAKTGSTGPGHRGPRPAPTMADGSPYRAFAANSWWNTPVPANAPQDTQATRILDYLRTAPGNAGGCLRLAGAHQNPWGQPVYWARPGDPRYDVTLLSGRRPPELKGLRIPLGARPAQNSDGSMSVFDLQSGYVTLLTDARYDGATHHWSASGASVTYLASNGLDVRTGRSNDPHNSGTHRGNNGADSVVRWDEVRAGAVDHVLKVSSGPELSKRWVFPMTGSDGQGPPDDPAVPPEGLRLRINPSVDLDRLGLHPQALVIAKALQTYGMYLGDSGGATALKLEDTPVEGRGQVWDVTTQDLCGLPFTPAYWEVLAEGYDPSSAQ
jgi:hypothetical protein